MNDYLNRVIQGDAMEVMSQMPDESVQCVITSPPYFGLRNYSLEPRIWGGKPDCEHVWGNAAGGLLHENRNFQRGTQEEVHKKKPLTHIMKYDKISSQFCSLCGAWRGSLGLEPTIELYCSHLVEIFREVRRVMRKDGILWLNMGDSYAGNAKPGGGDPTIGKRNLGGSDYRDKSVPSGLKPKDLCEIPSEVVRALRADGWWLRSRIPWLKRNSMPESITDRPATAVEYVFLLTKRAKCFYDNEAVKVPIVEYERQRRLKEFAKGLKTVFKLSADGKTGLADQSQTGVIRNLEKRIELAKEGTRNRRNSDWFFESWQGLFEKDGEPLALIVNPKGFKEAHFATFPEGLVVPCIKAGTSEKGCCTECGAPWERLTEKESYITRPTIGRETQKHKQKPEYSAGLARTGGHVAVSSKTIGWRPTCSCYDEFYKIEFPKARSARKRYQRDAWGDWWRRVRQRPGKDHWPVEPCTVLDPCGGAGTVAAVAAEFDRNYCSIELNPEYCEMQERRLETVRKKAKMGKQTTLKLK